VGGGKLFTVMSMDGMSICTDFVWMVGMQINDENDPFFVPPMVICSPEIFSLLVAKPLVILV